MITVTVETDEDEAAVKSALMGNGAGFNGQPFVMRRDGRAIAGRGSSAVIQFCGDLPPFGSICGTCGRKAAS